MKSSHFIWIFAFLSCPLVGFMFGDSLLLSPIILVYMFIHIKQVIARRKIATNNEALTMAISGTKRIVFYGQNQSGKASIEVLKDNDSFLLLYKRSHKESQMKKGFTESGVMFYSWTSEIPITERQLLFEEYRMTIEQRNTVIKWLSEEREMSIYNAKYLSNMLQMVCFGIEQNKVKKKPFISSKKIAKLLKIS